MHTIVAGEPNCFLIELCFRNMYVGMLPRFVCAFVTIVQKLQFLLPI